MGSLYRVTIHLDGKGVIIHPYEPLHLDGLIDWAGSFRYPPGEAPGRDDRLDPLPLPISSADVNGSQVYRASALFPSETLQDVRSWKKRFRMTAAEALGVQGTINQSTGPYRSFMTPMQVTLTRSLVGWFHGDGGDVRKWFKALRSVGRKRSMGYGRILGIDFDLTDEDRTLTWDGCATRWLPHPRGMKLVRPKPPYWHNHGRVACLSPGESLA